MKSNQIIFVLSFDWFSSKIHPSYRKQLWFLTRRAEVSTEVLKQNNWIHRTKGRPKHCEQTSYISNYFFYSVIVWIYEQGIIIRKPFKLDPNNHETIEDRVKHTLIAQQDLIKAESGESFINWLNVITLSIGV